MTAQHTPGPWRWEFNAAHKAVDLVGGRPMFDLTVMDFARWGMGHAVPRFRDTSVDGMNLMDRLCDKPEWIAPEPGREHHKKWHQLVTHPDARLMAAAPCLLAELRKARAALKEQLDILIQSHACPTTGLITDDTALLVIESDQDLINSIDAAIAKATGAV